MPTTSKKYCFCKPKCWKYSSRLFVLTDQCCQVRDFPVELSYFNIVATGCFSCPRVEATPIMWYLAPAMRILPRQPHQKTCISPPRMQFVPGRSPSKHPWAILGLVLSSNWSGFFVKTWQPCNRHTWYLKSYDNHIDYLLHVCIYIYYLY